MYPDEKPAIQMSIFSLPLHRVQECTESVKALKKVIKEAEQDVPMELEDLMFTLKNLQKQVKDRKEEHIKKLMEENPAYVEARQMLQEEKEKLADAKLELMVTASDHVRDNGDIDTTIVANGTPVRLQTQKENAIYLNGKLLKS